MPRLAYFLLLSPAWCRFSETISRRATRTASVRDLTPRTLTASSASRVSSRIHVLATAVFFPRLPCEFLAMMMLLSATSSVRQRSLIFGLGAPLTVSVNSQSPPCRKERDKDGQPSVVILKKIVNHTRVLGRFPRADDCEGSGQRPFRGRIALLDRRQRATGNSKR
jgi:hypothetical protein